jgi:hypothetical protein
MTDSHNWSWGPPSTPGGSPLRRLDTPDRVWTAMFGSEDADMHRIPLGFAERGPHPRSPEALSRNISLAGRDIASRIPADYAEQIPRPGSPKALVALNATLEDWADAEVEECGLHRTRPDSTVAAVARVTRSVTPLRHRLGVRPSRRSLEPLELRAAAATSVPPPPPPSTTSQSQLEGHTPDRSILESASSTRSGAGRRSLDASFSRNIKRSASASPAFSPPHSPLASRSPPAARRFLGRSPSPRAWYVREGGMRGGHMDTYEQEPVNVYKEKDRRAGKRIVFGQVMETPGEIEERAHAMKQLMRETERRISRQRAKPHILERAKAKEQKLAKRAAAQGGGGNRSGSPMRQLALMHGNGTTVRPSPWNYI